MKIKWSRDEINQFEIIENWLQFPSFCCKLNFLRDDNHPLPLKIIYFGDFDDDFIIFQSGLGHVIFIGKLWRITVLIAIIIFFPLSWRLQITCVLEWWIFDFLRYCNLITIIFQLKSFPFCFIRSVDLMRTPQNVESPNLWQVGRAAWGPAVLPPDRVWCHLSFPVVFGPLLFIRRSRDL